MEHLTLPSKKEGHNNKRAGGIIALPTR